MNDNGRSIETTKLLGPSSVIRFALEGGSPEKIRSDRWSAFRQGDDVYIAPSGLGGVQKISLHQSGVCRFAITENLASHSPPMPSSDRVIAKWRRASFAGVPHTQVLSLKFFRDATWVEHDLGTSKQVARLPVPPQNACREVAVFYSKTNPLAWKNAIWLTSNIMGVWQLSDDTFVTFRTRVASLPDEKRTRLIATANNVSITKMIVGEKDPSFLSAGHYAGLVSEYDRNFCTIYSIEGMPCRMIGRTADWSTKRGHKPA